MGRPTQTTTLSARWLRAGLGLLLLALSPVWGAVAISRSALGAERETSARCRSLAARLRSLAIEESNARSAASRYRGSDQRARAEVRLRRQMVNQAGCNMPMKPGDPRARRCFELKSRLRQAEQRARSRPVYGATPSAELARIRRQRQEAQAQYRLSGCPQGRVGQ
jgi:hypothetical protein